MTCDEYAMHNFIYTVIGLDIDVIGNHKILAIIAARGGSKGLAGKNLAEVGGKPLVVWSIEAAHQSQLIDYTILSSDDDNIIAAARHAGCDVPFVRPAALATDNATLVDVALHALDAVNDAYDYVVLLQATSPLRRAEDIDGCIRACAAAKAPAAVSVTLAAKHPRWMFMLDAGHRLHPLGSWDDLRRRRQDLPEAYAPNGAVYVAEVEWFRRTRSFYAPETIGFPMPAERSVDIDTALDLEVARALALR